MKLTIFLAGACIGLAADSLGYGQINNDDAVPSLTLNDVILTEGNSSSTNATG